MGYLFGKERLHFARSARSTRFVLSIVHGVYLGTSMNLSERIERANELLHPRATPHQGKLGRVYPEPIDERFPFERDRARIIETNAFRRMDGKTQVFVDGVSDHYRNRLTHTLEVADTSRGMARALRMNEDLTEAIALVHDIGHPPFGHQGEEVLNDLLREKKGFNHNLQGYRIVTRIESPYAGREGLNLNQEITEGMLKNGLKHPLTKQTVTHTLEAKIVDACDRVAYVAHDTQDGLSAKLFTTEQLAEVPLAREIMRNVGTTARAVRAGLLRVFLSDMHHVSEATLEGDNPSICMSAAMAAQRDQLYAFLKQHMYGNPLVHAKRQDGQKMITLLYRAYVANPPERVLEMQEKLHCSLERATADYIAGMSDSFLLSEAAKIA